VAQWGLMKIDSSILIVGAVSQEINPLIEKLNASRKISIGQRDILCGTLFNQSIIVVQSGIGMLNATQAVTAVVEKMPVHLIINTGCAGAFPDAGFAIGDIGIATQETDIHIGLESASSDNLPEKLTFPLIQTASASYFGNYPTSELYRNMAFELLSKKNSFDVHVKMMPFITVSCITISEQRTKQLFLKYQAGMENMEGAGVAHVALLYNKPFLEIRAASNYVGERDKRKWQLKKAFEHSTDAVFTLLKNMNESK
jgi:futalosine hydrolase